MIPPMDQKDCPNGAGCEEHPCGHYRRAYMDFAEREPVSLGDPPVEPELHSPELQRIAGSTMRDFDLAIARDDPHELRIIVHRLVRRNLRVLAHLDDARRDASMTRTRLAATLHAAANPGKE